MTYVVRLSFQNFRLTLPALRIILSFTTVLFSFLALINFHYCIITGRQYKIINLESSKLQNNLSNINVINYIHIINSIKKIPNTNNCVDILINTYNLVKSSKNINLDLIVQLRIALNLKGIDVK